MGIEQGYVFKQVCNFIIKNMIYVLRSECMLAICFHSGFSILNSHGRYEVDPVLLLSLFLKKSHN